MGKIENCVLTAFAALSIADVLSTDAALRSPGIIEANPLMAWCQETLGACWWVPKLIPLCLIAFALSRIQQARWGVLATGALVGLVYAAAIIGNVVNAGVLS